MKRLSVIYAGWGENWTLGELADNGRQLLFEYSPVALRQRLELSPLHLKLREQAYGGFPDFQMRLPGLIADSLPDGWGLLMMDKLFRRRGLDPVRLSPLDRLAFVSGRAMGALAFEPADKELLDQADVALLELARQVRDVIKGGSIEVVRRLALMGGSPHGARPKVLVNFDPVSGRVSDDLPGPGSPWLVKFQAETEHKEVCAIEAMYAVLARACGIEMPATHYFNLDRKLAAFGIERFDRRAGLRVPVHTVAGALNANFRLPSAVDYTTLLRLVRHMTRDEREVLKAFERCVFNVVFNNRDDHPKNFSFVLGRDRRWVLSPAYDLTFCDGPGGEHQMDICGEGRAPDHDDLLRLAKEGGLNPKSVAITVDRIASVAERFPLHAERFPIRRATVSRIAAAVRANLSLLAGSPSAPD